MACLIVLLFLDAVYSRNKVTCSLIGSTATLSLFFFAPEDVLPQLGVVGLLLWHLCRIGGTLSVCGLVFPVAELFPLVLFLRAPVANIFPFLAFLQELPLAANLHLRFNLPGQNVREMYTEFNTDRSALYDSLVVVSSCVQGGRFERRVMQASLENKQRYCAHSSAERPLRCALFNSSTPGTHHAKWEKYIRLREEMSCSRDGWFMWIDCDAVFTNAMFDWGDIVLNFSDDASASVKERSAPDMILARDRNGFNMGVFFLRNTPWSLGFLNAMLAMQSHVDQIVDRPHRKRSWQTLRDQQALDALLNFDRSLIHRIRVVPQKLINSFFSHTKGSGDLWEKGDWIAHQVDCDRAECNVELEDIANQLL